MSTSLGVLAAVFSGVLNGSFAVPMKRAKKWEWENIWLIYCAVAHVILPVGIAIVVVPGFLAIYADAQPAVVVQTFLFGFGYGLGAVTFGLGLHMLGLSLGYTIIIGIIAVTGSLIPLLVHDPARMLTPGGWLIILAMVVTVVGVVFCGAAGMIREAATQQHDTGSASRSRLKVGLLVCVVSGILSAMLNLAFDFGAPIAEVAKAHLGSSATTFSANHTIWVLALAGAFIPNAVYCGYLLVRKKSWKKYTESGTARNWLWALLMATLWIGCILSYGAGASMLGKFGTTLGWLILMAVTVLVGNLWGVLTGEWTDSPKQAKRRMMHGLLLLIGSVALVALAKALMN
jgi:L-rhamnose-H+ transport protein